MAMMDRTGVARSLEQIASYLEFQGENPFRVRAFNAAARSILGVSGDLDEGLRDGSLAQTRGIGPAILQIVSELVTTGRATILDQLRAEVPAGLVDMLGVPGLGVAKIRQIHEVLGISTLPELEDAARDGRLAALPRFGARTAEKILQGIAFLRQTSELRLSHHAAQEAEAFRTAFERVPGIAAAHTAGAVRRRAEVVEQLVTLLVSNQAADAVFESLASMPGVTEIAGRDERRATLRFAGGSSVEVLITPPRNFGAMMVQATGNDAHLEALAAHAAARGFTLAGAALWNGSAFVPTPTEESLYQSLGLPCIPPELREGRGALDRPVPTLVTARDVRGILHCHTSASDGSNSVEQLADACRALGYEYLGITDHSRAAAYAGGLSPEAIRTQWAEIDQLNARYTGFRILKGIESDILVDGALDYEDEILAGFDFVIGSVHSRFNLGREEMTERVCRAVRSPYLTILGHPTGRLLLSRPAYALDLDRVFEAAAESHAAIEINADPHRLDLDWRTLDRAHAHGVTISIGVDAHNTAGLNNLEYGIGIARKGGLAAEDILNCRDVDGFLAFARARR